MDPALRGRLNLRQRRLWRLHDFADGRGLEIGPLHKATVDRDLADVRYLDVFDRARLVENYRNDPNVPTDRIPEIDYVLLDGDQVRSIPEVIGAEDRFQWVVASHVIEHVPDLIGWLGQVAEVTEDGGALVLVVPDRRYCFDIHRPGTTVGQVLQAHETGEVVPSVRAVYDHYRSHVFTNAAQAWAGNPPGHERRSRSLPTVLDLVARARTGEYVDAHVWTFTPDSFVEQMIELRTMGQSAWIISKLRRTRPDELEFYAVLRRLPRDPAAPSPWLEGEVRPRGDMPDWLAETVRLRAKVANQRRTIRRQRRRIRTLRARIAGPGLSRSRLRARLARLARRGG